MRKKALIAALAVVLAACGGTDDTPAAPEPTPAPAPAPAPPPDVTPEPEKDPDTYGDDPVLDRLWDRCADGQIDACDELYWDSPLGSDYEAYALRRVNELEGVDPASGDDVIDQLGAAFFLDMVWDGMTNAEKDDICLGLEIFGAEGAAALIVSEAPDFDLGEVAEWLIQTCR